MTTTYPDSVEASGDIPDDLTPLEWKALPGGETSSPLTGVIGHDDAEGTITALVAVSGVVDSVGDVIVPGSLSAAIKRLKPKGVMSHNWGEKVSKLVWHKELMPGDPMLPQQTPDGQPWPANAGGLLIKAKYNLDKQSGRDAYADAKFYGPDECFSIGYKVRPGGARMRNGKRYLNDFDLYEWSQVLHGAHPLATLTGVKSLADTVDGTWYDGTRSGDIEGDTALPDGVELKVRVVRNADFWHLPIGTPIKPGMIPHGLNRPPTEQELHSTTAESGDDAGVHGAPDGVATPGVPAPPMPDMALPLPGPKDGDAPTGDAEKAIDALRKRVGEIGKVNTPAARTASAALTPFLVPGAPVRASADGQLVAVHTGDAWRVADTANGGVMQLTLPGTLPQPNVDMVLHELAGAGIPWDSVEARRKRWADNPAQLQADRAVVQGIFARAGTPQTLTPPGMGGAGQAALPPPPKPGASGAPNAPAGAPPVAPGVPPAPVGPSSGYAAPPAPQTAPAVAAPPAGAPSVPSAPAVVPPPAGAPTVSPKKFPRGSLKGHGVQPGDRIRVHGHPKGTLEGVVETGKTGHHLVHDDGTKTWIGGAGSRHQVEKLGKAADQPPKPEPKPEPAPEAAKPAAPEPYQPTGNINTPHKLTDEQLATEAAHAAARYARARSNGLPKTSVEHHDAKLGHTVFQDEIRRRATGGEHTPDTTPAAPAPESAPVKPADAVRVPPEIADGAHKVRADALGIIDGPDGQEELTPEAADRQDRVEAHLAAGEAALADQTDAQLGETRKDLTDELALQNELARRDAERRKEVAAAKAAGAQPDKDAPAAGEDTGPKLRPGVAGAAEDLGDLLNAKPRDDEAVKAAADRFAKLLRRHGDSSSFDAVRTAIGDDIHAAIASGELRAGMLFTAAGGVREERRLARNEGAKKRRLAKRIDRDRIKALIGSVDTELRARKDRKRGAAHVPTGPVPSTVAPSKLPSGHPLAEKRTVRETMDAAQRAQRGDFGPAPAKTDPRAAAEQAIRDGDRIALVDALRQMGDPGPRETAMRLRELPENEAIAGLDDIRKPDDALNRDDAAAARARANAKRAAVRNRDQGAQSPATEGGDHERTSSPDRGVVPDARAGGVPGDRGQTGVLRRTGRPGDGADRATDRRDSGTGPAGGDLRPQTGAPQRSEPSGDVAGDEGLRDVPTAPELEGQRGAESGDTGPEHPAGREPGGSEVPPGDGGLRDSERGIGRPAPDSAPEDTAGPAAPDEDTGAPEPVTAADQPEADAGQVDAIPDTGESFHPTGDALAPAGKKAKLEANLAALRVLRTLQTEKRSATPEEQTVLSRWAGWGGLPDVFDDRKTEYAKERTELRGLLSDSEWNEARRNTLNAHYTDPRVVQSVWQAVADLGFDGGRVLEPGSGSGTFIGFAPPDADMVGVELDSTTAAISRALYPHATIRNESFAKTRLPSGSFDATVGNVPFGQFSLNDRVHNPGSKMSIHNHFIVKSLAMTKPGGVVALLTSRYTLDAKSPRDRKRMAEMGDLIGAVRLPTGSHSKASGTNVIEDVLIFRRREPGAAPLTSQDWVNASERDIDGHPIVVNDYFTAHPDNVLGELHAEKGQYGTGSLIVRGDRDMTELPAALTRITDAAKADGVTATPRMHDLHALVDADLTRHEGHIAASEDGGFTQAAQGVAKPFEVPEKQAEELRGLIGMRDTLSKLLTAEATSVSNSPEIKALRATLNDQYDAYVKRYGPINRYTLTKTGARNAPGQGGFRRDPMSAIVRALEIYNPETGKAVKTDIFTKRASSPREIPTHADNPADALALSLDTYGEVNLPEIAKMLGVSEQAARHQLGDLVFEQPPLTDSEQERAWTAREAQGLFGDEEPTERVDLSSVGESIRAEGRLEPAAAYLSGNVRRKLAAAQAAAAHDERFAPNVEALKKVIPADLGVDEVDGRLGAAWIPADDVKQFMLDLLHDGDGRYNPVQVATSGGGIWTVKGGDHGNKATEEWGTKRKSAGELIAAMLEQRPIRVNDTIDGKTYQNLEETLAAQAKADELQERFSEWLFEDSDRTKRLLRSYNDQFNAIRLRNYDDMPRVFPGMADSFVPRDHQVGAVNRIVSEPCALLAHVVGAGKTAEMAMGAAELKRLGMAKKPAIIVPSHMLEQFTREYLEIYPNAKILAAGTDDIAGDRRREFVARAATGQWDCVILTKDAMQLIPMSPEATSAYIDREMATMRAQLEAAQAEDGGDSARQTTIKKMEKAVVAAEQALTAKLEKTKDAGVSFEQTGIDYLFVDEAHQYSNLRTVSNIQGAGATGSGIATDLHMKIEHLRANNASGRVATFATGTPIRNTVTQAYIMQRFMRPDLLKEAGVNSFDQWAATFGQTVDEMELKPEGTGFRQTTRFAKFRNVPELLRLFQIFADVKTADDLKLPTPELEGGEVDNVVVPSTPELKEMMAELATRADHYRAGNPDKRMSADGGGEVDDMMLLISMDGRKAAMQLSNKLDIAADKMAEIWQRTKDKPVPKDLKDPTAGDDPPPGGMQIVFCDMFTPGGTGSDEFNAYETLRSKLAERGMDPKTIRFMHEAKNDRQKAELFAAARNGQISVLIGSTEKMGVGTNVQRRAVALHHLDAPWRPSDLEQRDGRIMRQGNANDTISIHRYVTEGSFDAYMWQTLERKKKFIDQIMRGSLDQREIEDVGETALSYAEVKALATGNPLLLDKATVDTAIGKLSRLERTHNRTQTNLRRDVESNRTTATASELRAAEMDAAIAKRTDTTTGDDFALTVHGTTTHDRGEAVAMLKASIEDVIRNDYGYGSKAKPVAVFGGHKLMAQVDTYYDKAGIRRQGVALTWDGVPGGKAGTFTPAQITTLGAGTLIGLHNSLHAFEFRRDDDRRRAANLRGEADVMEKRIGTPFPHAAALKAARAESERLKVAMEAAGMTDTGAAGESESAKALATARTKAAAQASRMGRSGGGAAANLKRFGNSTASPGAVASPDGAIGAFGKDHELHVFLTDDGVDLRDIAGITSTNMPGVIDNAQALVDDLEKLDLPFGEGAHALYRRWNDYTYVPPDYTKSYEEREKAAQERRDKVKAVEVGDKTAIRAVFARHMVADTSPAKTGVELAKANSAAAAGGSRIGDLAKKRLQRFAKASKRIEHYASDDGTIAAVADTNGHLEYFSTGNGMLLNDNSLERPIADPQAVVDDLAALGIPLGDQDARWERWGKGDGQQQRDLEAIKAVYRRHMAPEEKAIISAMDLARAQRVGIEGKLRAATPPKPDLPDDGADIEPFTQIVVDDVRYVMDASGVLQRLTECPECGAQMTVPAYGGSSAPPCPACGVVPEGIDSRRAPIG